MNQEEIHLVIHNELGLHLRAASKFVHVASRFKSDIFVEKEGVEVNGKSIMGILSLAAGKGSAIRLRIKGEDATAALNQLQQLINDKFGES